MQYREGPFGILVPAFPTISNKKTGADFKPANRKRTGERGHRPAPTQQSDLRYLGEHVRGRVDAAAELLTDIAFLKSRDMAREAAIVTSTGAVYQDRKGSTSYPRAHRFPVNPLLGYDNVPDLAGWSSLLLRNRLKVPLAITDPLPVVANYADRLFEAHTTGPVERAVQWVLIEQPKGRPVHENLIRHVLERDLLPGFLRAYAQARQDLQNRTDDQLPDLLMHGPLSNLTAAHLTQLFRPLVVDPDAPSQNVEAVSLVLDASLDTHRSYQPALMIEQTESELQQLSQDSDTAASHDKLPSSLQAAKRPVAH